MAPDYSDLSRPSLRADDLRRALVAPYGPLARLDVLEEVGSTNTWLLERAAAAPQDHPHLSAVLAEHQNAGRGRLGRSWSAPPRSALFASVLLRLPDVPRERWSWLPLLAGASVAGVLRRTTGVQASVKWPNDVLVDPAEAQPAAGKVAGVLSEVSSDASAVVVGVGLNVSLGREELPVPAATSLALAGAASTDRDVLARAVLRSLADDVSAWIDAGGDAEAGGLAARVRETCSTIGTAVRVELPGGAALLGVAEGIDADGRLLVRPDDDGGGAGAAATTAASAAVGASGTVAVGAGDVVHLR